MAEKLDVLDKKLIVELDKNARQSLSQLAKKLRTSQQVVSYRLNKLVESKVIKTFMTALSTRSLGLPLIVKMYVQLTGVDVSKEKEIFAYLLEHSDVNWVCKTLGDFDLFTAVMVKDIDSFGEFKQDLFQKFGKHINNYEVSFLNKAYTFPRSYLIGEKEESIKPRLIHEGLSEKINEKDKKIISLIVNNARINIIDLAKKAELNVKTAISRLRNLEKTGAIQGYRINVNRKNMDWKYYKVFIKLHSFDQNSYNKLLNYLLSQKYVLHLIECIGKYELELEMEMPNSETLQDLVKDIRNNYADTVQIVLVTEILEELKLTWLPNRFAN